MPKSETVQIDFIKPPETKKDSTTVIEKQQVVDQDDKPLNDEKPTDTKFLSAHNQVVKRQTVARNNGEFKNSKAPVNKSGDGGNPEAKPLTVDDLKPKFDISKAIQNKMEIEKDREKKSEDDAIAAAEKPKVKKDQPTQSQPRAETPGDTGAQASQSIDYIKDLDPGLETLLSTKEFVYYTYYSRIRRQLNQHWGPKVREKLTQLYRSGRMIASSDDKVTKLLITLDPKGNLLKAQIIGDSGVRDLDEAAVESFRAAAPFPNPPEGMKDPDGLIKIRWDFILEA